MTGLEWVRQVVLVAGWGLLSLSAFWMAAAVALDWRRERAAFREWERELTTSGVR